LHDFTAAFLGTAAVGSGPLHAQQRALGMRRLDLERFGYLSQRMPLSVSKMMCQGSADIGTTPTAYSKRNS
jgi:hypothetical protein